MEMQTLNLIGKGKMNQKAALLLLSMIEKLREMPFENLKEGYFAEASEGQFSIDWRITDNCPYFGTKQIQIRVLSRPAATVIVESLFYRVGEQ